MRSAWCWLGRATAIAFLLSAPRPVIAESSVERNVVYGMYSGLALLMDVHRPERPNGLGVVFVSGSAWTAPLGYGAGPLKENQVGLYAPALLGAGYTVFAINHRATPRFAYPDPLEDVQRAVRFVRHNAARYGVAPEKLAGIGGSSGGHLIGLAAMLGSPGVTGDPDAVNREPATLQCVILRAAPVDLSAMIGASALGTAAVTAFTGRLLTPRDDDREIYRRASPLTHVSRAAPPTLLVHGDADDIIPYAQSEAIERSLRAAGVPVRLVRVGGGVHGPNFGTDQQPHEQFPELLRQIVAWLDEHLR